MVHDALRFYEGCTAQFINPSKCSIMFGKACIQADQDKVKEVLQVDKVAADQKYLGLPTPEGRITKDKLKSTKEKLTRRFTN
jgi:hypothetical protein